MEPQYQYDAFISYRHLEPDQTAAIKLQTMLESYRPPKGVAAGKRIRRIFRDSSELPTQGALDDALTKALSSSRYLILVLSEATKESKWCMAEVDFFIKLHGGKTDRILPVLVSGEPSDILPDVLRFTETRETQPDGTEKIVRTEKEPICSDFRAATPKGMNQRMKTEFLRLAAPLLGCGFDDLYQRHKKRKRRRIAIITAAVLAIVLGYAGILLHNYLQIQQKNRELASANKTLTEQKTELQIRESGLLTAQAQLLMQADNDLEALRTALDALPDNTENGNRPLYKPAESILWQIMNRDRNRWWQYDSLTFNATLTSETGIWRYSLSSDARECYILDIYGTVRKYRTFSNALEWETDLPMQATSVDMTAFELLLSEKHGCVFVNTEARGKDGNICQVLSALDCADGHLLWRMDIQGSYKKIMMLSPDENSLSFLSVADGKCYLFDLRNGVSDDLPYQVCEISSGNSISEYGICFSQDSTGILGGAFLSKEDGKKLRLFMMDPNDPAESKILDVDGPAARIIYAVDFSKEANQFFTVTANETDKPHNADISCFDLQSGALLWQVTTPDEMFKWSTECRTLPDLANGVYLLSVDRQVFAFDTASGSLIAQTRLDNASARTIDLYSPEDGIYCGVLSDGDCWAGWLESKYGEKNLFTYDYSLCFPGAVLRSSPLDLLERAGGIRDAHWNEDHSFPVLDMGSGFSAYTIGSRDVRIEWRLAFDQLWRPYFTLPMKHGEYIIPMMDEQSALVRDGKITFVIKKEYDEDGLAFPDFRLATLDLQTYELRETAFDLPIELYLWGKNGCQFLPVQDSDDVLIDLYGAAIKYFDASQGKMETLYAFGGQDEAAIMKNGKKTASILAALQTRDGAALAAACDGQALRLWRNGTSATEIPLPEKTVWQYSAEGNANHLQLIGSNGYFLLGDFASPDSPALARFMACDTSSGVWTAVQDEAQGVADRDIAMAHAAPLFAVADADRMIRIYDMKQGVCVQRIAIRMPETSIKTVGFSSDDQFMFCSMEGRIRIYEVASGKLVWQSEESINQLPVSVTVDADTQQMYICSGDEYDIGSINVIVDMVTWSQKAVIRDVLAFVPELGRMVMYASVDWEMQVRLLPTSQQIIDMGHEALQWIEEHGAAPRIP